MPKLTMTKKCEGKQHERMERERKTKPPKKAR